MLDSETKRRIDAARDILVGKLPDPKAQVEQITIALIYKFMDDMDKQSVEMGGKPKFFSDEYAKYAWSKIFDPRMSGVELVGTYGEALQRLNQNPHIPQLFRDIFKNAYLPYRDPETLRSFLKTISEFEYDHSEKLGDAFEYLLSVMGSQGDAGQFRTPRHIIDFIVSVVNPTKNDTVLDPACGTAGFLISAYKHILGKNSSEGHVKLTPDERKRLMENFVGYDISPDMVRLSLVNLYLHSFSSPQIHEYDTLTSEEKWNDYFDVVLANPPFMTPKGGIRPHGRFSVKANRSEVLFVDYIHEHLNPNGRAGIIVPEGIIFQSGTAYKKLRKMLVEESLYAVISLPAGVFNPYSGVKTSILLLDKSLAKKTQNVLFVRVDNDGYNLGAQRREVKGSNLPLAKEIVKKYRDAVLAGKECELLGPEQKNAVIVEKVRIAENGDYNLTGERYREAIVYDGKWDLVELGKAAEVKKGSPITKKDISKGDVPVVAGGQNPAYFHNEANRTGEIITVSASGAYAGFVNYFHQKIWASDCTTIQSLDENIVLTKFIYHMLKGKQDAIYAMQRGGGQPHIYPKDLTPFKIPLPPLDVQEQIVEELECYQNIVDGARKVVENYKPSFKIDPEWEMVELGNKDYFSIESGGTPDSNNNEYWNGDINWATLVDLPSEDHITILQETKRKITKEGLKNSSAKLLPEKTILVSSRATIGRIAIAQKPTATNQGFKNIVIKDFDSNNEYFVALMVSTLVDKMHLLASGGTFKEISKTSFSTLKIPLPSIEEQNLIVSEVQKEQELVHNNCILINLFQEKTDRVIAELWGEE